MARVTGVNRLKFNLRKSGKATTGRGGMQALRDGGDVIRDEARANIAAKLNKDSRGTLSAATVTTVSNDKKAEIGPRGVVYARIHEFGGMITPKRAAALFIPLKRGAQPGQEGLVWGEDFILSQLVNMPARPYLRPAADTKGKAAGATVGDTLGQLITKAIR